MLWPEVAKKWAATKCCFIVCWTAVMGLRVWVRISNVVVIALKGLFLVAVVLVALLVVVFVMALTTSGMLLVLEVYWY